MRYQPVLVLSTLAVGQAAAANHRHASFHARRSGAAAGPEAIEWNKVVRDAIDYDAAIKAADISQSEWDAIWKSDHPDAPAPTQAPASSHAAAPAVTPTVAAALQKGVDQSPPKKPDTPKPSSAAAAPAAKPSKQSSSGGGSDIVKSIGCVAKANPTAPNGQIWVGGGDAKVRMTWTNDGDEDAAVICWDRPGMFNFREQFSIAVNIAAGESVDISMAPSFSGGCGPAFKGTGNNQANMLNETILEFTAAPENPPDTVTGVYDVSREVNMAGVVMHATGSRKCTSGVLNGVVSCLFGCVATNDCEATGTYGLTAGGDKSGMCNMGKDQQTGGDSGGCQFEPTGDHLQVTFSNDRNWPQASY